MSITVTYTTLDHRYFMRRTKREIISHIEQLQGRKFDFSERLATLAMTKDQIADEAMRLVRALPAPPDPVDVITKAIIAELLHQADKAGPSPYVDARVPDHVKLDGFFDLRELARAALEADASRARRDQVIDKLAAAWILQGAIDRLNDRR